MSGIQLCAGPALTVGELCGNQQGHNRCSSAPDLRLSELYGETDKSVLQEN